jgi:hypothetical protein
LPGVGFREFAQALDEGRVVDGDPRSGGLSREKAGSGAQQIAGVHQDDAAVHAFHPLSGAQPCFEIRDCCGFPSSLPDHGRVDGRNSIIGVADRAAHLLTGADYGPQ